MAIRHYPPIDEVGARRIRDATVAWLGLIGELHGVGLRPYLELEMGEAYDDLRLYCDLDGGRLLDVSIGDSGIPDVPPRVIDAAWTAFVQDDDGYLAEVLLDPSLHFAALASKLKELVAAVQAGERPFLEAW